MPPNSKAPLERRSLHIGDIRLNGGTQPRVEVSADLVDEYALAMAASATTFPPPVVYFDGDAYWLADGFHRMHAAKSLDRQVISFVRFARAHCATPSSTR